METSLGRKAVRFGAAMLAVAAIASPGLSGSAWAKGSSPAKLDQCADGPLSAPVSCVTTKSWVNGNLGPSKSHYYEGDSIPYRLQLGGLTPGADVHTAVIQWDTTDAHARRSGRPGRREHHPGRRRTRRDHG